MMRFFLLSILLSAAAAFTVAPKAFGVRTLVPSTTARSVILTDEETQAILESAEECHDSECSVEDVNKLIENLQQQEGILSGRLVKIMNLIAQLQHVNEKKERKTDEVRQFVKDMLRVFSHENPSVMPSGFAGDIGEGAKTAWDVLPPKPWKPADKE